MTPKVKAGAGVAGPDIEEAADCLAGVDCAPPKVNAGVLCAVAGLLAVPAASVDGGATGDLLEPKVNAACELL